MELDMVMGFQHFNYFFIFFIQPKTKTEDNYHFIAYVPVNGKIYELDGLQEAPIFLADINENQDWVTVVRPLIQRRIEKYTKNKNYK